jgi:hypothetical protein
MTTFVIKSAICLAILYGFYHIFLRNLKVFDFNRYYLLFSLLFSTVVPLITIHVNLNLPVNSNILGVSDFTGTFMQGKEANAVPIQFLTFQNSLIILYLIISTH